MIILETLFCHEVRLKTFHMLKYYKCVCWNTLWIIVWWRYDMVTPDCELLAVGQYWPSEKRKKRERRTKHANDVLTMLVQNKNPIDHQQVWFPGITSSRRTPICLQSPGGSGWFLRELPQSREYIFAAADLNLKALLENMEAIRQSLSYT